MPKLTTDAEARLIEEAQEDTKAMEYLIHLSRHSIRAAVNGAASFEILDVDDLVQVGTIAFVEAVRSWTPGHRLWEVAKRPVMQAAYDEVARMAGVSGRTLRRIGFAFRESNGDRALAREFACSPERGPNRVAEETFDAVQSALRDDVLHKGTEMGTSETGLDDHTVALMQAVSSAAHVLSDRERQVLEMHYGLDGEPMTDGAIAASFGIDRSRIVRVRNRAIQRLRDEIFSKGLTLKS